MAYVGSIRTRRTDEGNVDTSNVRNALLEIVGDIDLYKLLKVVAYTQRESAFTADRDGKRRDSLRTHREHFVFYVS